ncbi:MAG TPA: hypothetical protein VLA36_06790 [Longimicrobiales bacterium]|nr:hypothetical protein [Longimicrobiales bacterium]
MRRAMWVLVAAVLAGRPAPGAAQEAPRVTVRVRQVAGSSVYLDLGTRHGLRTGDTVQVARDSTAAPVGSMVVTASTETRSVLTFSAEPFAVTRGDLLTLLLLRAPAEAPEDVAPLPVPPREPPAVEARPAVEGEVTPAMEFRGFTPRAHGRIALDMSTNRSITRVGGADAVDVERMFATPALRFDVTAPGAVGGFTLHTSARLAYRYSDGVPLGPTTSARVYAASLERDFTAVPLKLVFGRFYSPVEQYSGVWDGALFRIGRGGFGVGAIAGFQPDRWNERPSTEFPKATVFVDGRARGRGWRWQGNVSAHTVRPGDSLPTHSFVGATQRITLGRLFLGHDVQMDRDPTDARWRLSRLRLRASLDMTDHVALRAGFARRESYVMRRLGSPFSPRNDRLDGGLALRAGGGFLSADGSVSEDASGRRSWGLTGAFASGRLPIPSRPGLTGSVSRWSGTYGTSLSAAPGLELVGDRVRFRAGYRYNRSDYLQRVVLSHGADASLDAPLGNGMRLSARARVQWGGLLLGQGLDVTLSRIF